MNANEMADELAKVPIEIFGKVRMIDVRVMLRQQQAEIEALKAKQAEVLAEVKTSWTAISPVSGIPRESAHQLYEILKDILK